VVELELLVFVMLLLQHEQLLLDEHQHQLMRRRGRSRFVRIPEQETEPRSQRR
jgi:hypothetical protein